MAGEEAQRLIAAASHAEEHNTHGELTVGLGDPVTSSLREFPRTGSDGDAAAFSLPVRIGFPHPLATTPEDVLYVRLFYDAVAGQAK